MVEQNGREQTENEVIRDLLERRAELIHDARRGGDDVKYNNSEALLDLPENLRELGKEKREPRKRLRLCALIIAMSFVACVLFFIREYANGLNVETRESKPIVYLYPENRTNVTVKLEYNGKLTYTYPQYNGGWNVVASPDGTLINHADGREYSYLFWEGESRSEYDFSKGFVVKGSDTVAFLQEKLAYLGLTPREYNEFIVYWLPQMQDNPYNLIAFQSAAYTDNAKLTITPEPDSVLRVFMAFKPLKHPVDIPPQELKTFERKGFVVVEWGGTQVH